MKWSLVFGAFVVSAIGFFIWIIKKANREFGVKKKK